MIWTSIAGYCVSRGDRFAENTLYTVDLGRTLSSFTLYFTPDGTRRIEVTGDVVTVGWPNFGRVADEKVMVETVVHMITGYYMAFKEAK